MLIYLGFVDLVFIILVEFSILKMKIFAVKIGMLQDGIRALV